MNAKLQITKHQLQRRGRRVPVGSSCELDFALCRFPRGEGFTLIELLITISLVIVLILIVVPTSERAIHKSRATHCLSNLRSLGTALQLYLNDNNNVMPTLVTARESKDSEEESIDNTLIEYADNKDAFCCKADNKKFCQTTGTSYLWNNLLNGQNASDLNFFGFIKDGTRIPVISDKEGWHMFRNVQVNILYADGHVAKDIKFVTSGE
jgi:prepilin-type processing-associated H-X9-DG protein